METVEFCSFLKDKGFDFFVGVPCSILKNVIERLLVDSDVSCVIATREEEAIGIATGVSLGGKKPVVFMQNSGLGNSINALTSLVLLYKIPMLLLISWRGYRGKDAPEHLIMGKCVLKLLKDVGVPTQVLPKKDAEQVISSAVKIMEKKQTPVTLVIKRGVIE